MPDSLTKFQKDETKKPDTTSTVVASPSAPVDPTTLASFQLKDISQVAPSYHLHKYGGGNKNTECKIAKTDLTDGFTGLTDGKNDILCWMEADELTLYFNGANLQVNSPTSACEYTQLKPYYYWDFPPVNSKIILKNVICASNTGANCLAQTGGRGPTTATKQSCLGDYTALGGPNCDEGYITTTTYNITESAAGPPVVPATMTSSESTVACGGKRSNCYGGPGVDYKVDTQGMPAATDYLSYIGLSLNYTIAAPGVAAGGKGFSTNHYIANFTTLFSTIDPDPTIKSTIYDYTKSIPKPGSPNLSVASTTGFDAWANKSAISSSYLSYQDNGIVNYDDMGASPFYLLMQLL